MIFDWDENKEKRSIKNHDGVTSEEASPALQDDLALEEYDDEHSTADEKRYSCIGEGGKKVLYIKQVNFDM